MGVLLLVIFISISYLIVRIGAIALEMTGMERSMARFQALSAFSGTGFTTREAERVVNHPRRRRIVTYLIILGNAGIVSVIATFVISLRAATPIRSSLNLILIAASLFILWRVATQQKLARQLTDKIKETLRKKFHFEAVKIEEILQQPDGYGIASVLVGKDSKLVGVTLGSSGLTKADIMILSIERDSEVITFPKAQNKIRVGDQLVCYGNLENLNHLI